MLRGYEKARRVPHDPNLFLVIFSKRSVMSTLLQRTREFLVNEDGPTAVEYAVMLALIIVVCLTAIQAIGTNANATFNSVAGVLPGGGS
jgi:pilus assembly protein Flp/PilA